MNHDYYYYREKRECTKCGKRSIKRVYGCILGAEGPMPLFNILRYTNKGKEIDSHKCPHCGYQHKVPFGKAENTFPLMWSCRAYKKTTEADAKGN